MADLTGNTVQSTYKDLLQVSNSNSGVDGTLRKVEDGEGTETVLRLSTGAVSINGITYPTSDGTNGQAIVTDGSGTLSFSTISGGGGGDLGDLDDVTITSAATGDFIRYNGSAWVDVAASQLETDLNHDNLTGFVANEHIDHTSVTITAGEGLSGGGDISANRSFAVDLNELTTITSIASGDFIPYTDVSDSNNNKKITFANFEGALNHDNLAGFVSNEHIDWTSASNNLSTTGTGTFEDYVAVNGTVSDSASIRLYEDTSNPGTNYFSLFGPASVTGNSGSIRFPNTPVVAQGQVMAASATTASGSDSAITLTWQSHDDLDGFVANEHIDWTSTSSNFSTSGSITGTGVVDFGGATSFELPSGTSVTTNATGEIALDTNGNASTITTGVLQVFDGTQNTYVVSSTNYPSSDNDVPAYDSATNAVVWQAQSGAGGGLSNVVEDTTPQLGGQLDVNGQAIGDGTRELLTFTEDASAVNHVNIENQATGSGPIISAAGDDTNVDLVIDGKGSGDVVLSSSNIDITGNIVVSGTVDGRDVAADGTKLDGIESNATADMTTEEIQDIAGPLAATGGTKTGITVTYQDATGDMDFVVSDTTVAGDTGSTGITPGDTLTIAGGTEITTAMSGDTLTINSDFTPSSTDTLTNKTFDANGTGNSLSNVDVADLANGTDGELITWDASGAPATVAVGTSGHVLTSNGVGAAPTFQAAAGGGSTPDNYLTGLTTSNATDADHDITVAVGFCRDSTNAADMDLTSAITKRIDANWTEGSAAGGFPSGLTLSADTWYHFFVISKTDGTVDAGWDTSTSATNLLSDASTYTYYRRIASHLTNSSSNIIGYQQKEDVFMYNAIILDLSDTSPANTKTNITVSTPADLEVMGIFRMHGRDSSQTWINVFGSTDDDSAPGTDNSHLHVLSASQCMDEIERLTDDSTISYRSTNTAMDGFGIRTAGYRDTRGK